MPLAQAAAADASRGHGELALRQLVADVVNVVRLEGVAPDQDTVLDVRERHVADDGADHEQHEPERKVAPPSGRCPEHEHEDGEEQERRAQVLLDEQDREGDEPRHEQRSEVARLRQPDRPDPARFRRRAGRGLRTSVRDRRCAPRDRGR